MKVFCLSLVAVLSMASALRAGPIPVVPTSSCAADFSSCNVYENQLTSFPGLAISGDVIIQSGIYTIGVFRIFNDFFDTGGGTGLGFDAFLYSAAFYNIPDPATYSVNAVTIPVGLDQGNGFTETVYNGNGTDYNLFLVNPEPSTFALLAMGGALLAWRRRSPGNRRP